MKKKVKTRKSVTKRFKFTKTGKVLRGRSFTSHLNSKRSSKQKRRLSGTKEVTTSFAKRLIKRMGIKKGHK